MKITRRTGLAMIGGGIAAASLPAFAPARTREFDLRPVEIADGVWMIEGKREYFSDENGGNIVNSVLVETQAGVIVVDTGSSLKHGEALRRVAGALGPGSIAAVVNTHHHPDHFFGNQVFADRPIHALAGTAEAATAQGDAFSDNLYRLLGDWMRGTEPTPPNAILTTGSLEIGGRRLRVMPLSGHTAADLALLDEKTGVLIAGDLAFLDRAPTTPHADLAQWRKSIRELEALQASGVVPGHGPFDTQGRAFAQTLDYLDWLEATLRSSAEEGLDMVEIMNLPMPERFASMGANPEEFRRSVVHLFPAMERASLPDAAL